MKLRWVWIAAAALPLAGCYANHLIYAQETVLGVDASLSTEGIQKMAIGFNRDTYAIVPKKGAPEEAMSATSMSRYCYVFPAGFTFEHFIATGPAAVSIAKDPKVLKKIRGFVYQPDPATGQPAVATTGEDDTCS